MVNDDYLRNEKKKALLKWHDSNFYKKDVLQCVNYYNATILPLKKIQDDALQFGRGGVFVDQEYVQCSGIEGRVGGWYPFEKSEYRDKKVVYCGALISQWGHFLIESVSRLWYYLENDETIDSYVFISNNKYFNSKDSISGNYREFFELLGIWDILDVVSVPTRYREVLIPELGYSRKYYYSDAYKSIFDRVVEKALLGFYETGVAYQRVFLSRSKLKKASQSECGLDMLDNYFSKNGYVVLYPETISLRKLIWYLNSADVCAAESGTLPHNFLFCKDNKKVEIIERQTTVNEIQANIDQIKNFDVTYIDACFMIYPVSAGAGPFFLAYTRQFEDFTRENGFLPPDPEYLSDKYLKKNLKKYMDVFKRFYGFRWGMEKWQLMYAEAYYEAYADTCLYVGEYLDRIKPLYLVDYISKNNLKRVIKRFIKVNTRLML